MDFFLHSSRDIPKFTDKMTFLKYAEAIKILILKDGSINLIE